MIFSMYKIFMHNIRRVLGEKKNFFIPNATFLSRGLTVKIIHWHFDNNKIKFVYSFIIINILCKKYLSVKTNWTVKNIKNYVNLYKTEREQRRLW